jgi:hypothetical protein
VAEGAPGYRLYEDFVDELGNTEGRETPVYLRLEGVAVTVRTTEAGAAEVTVRLPRALARELGLLADFRRRARAAKNNHFPNFHDQ